MANSKKEQLLSAGLEAMFEKGFEKTTIDDIVQNASCGKGTFYRYFKNKEDLLDTLTNNFGESLSKELKASFCSKKSFRDNILALMKTYFAKFRDNHKLGFVIHQKELSHKNIDSCKHPASKIIIPQLSQFRECVQQAIEDNTLEKNDPETLVNLLFGSIHFFLFREKILGLAFNEVDLEKTLDIILNGALKK